MNNIFKPITLKWWQVSVVKLSLISFGILVAIYWPTVLEWKTFWWIVFVATMIYLVPLRFRNR